MVVAAAMEKRDEADIIVKDTYFFICMGTKLSYFNVERR